MRPRTAGGAVPAAGRPGALPRRLALLAAAVTSLGALPGVPAAAPAPDGRAGRVRFEYVPPKDPAHRPAYDQLRQARVLETFAEVLGTVRLPRTLTLRFEGCDGESNAWYDPDVHAVTFCYELVAEVAQASAGAGRYGISPRDATEGPVVYLLLHESAHALFDLLQVPILGREEDAADQVAAYVLLRAGPGVARRVLAGAAWMYRHDASQRTPDESDFADVHGLDVQRFYNVLCMAYGSDPAGFGGLVEKGYLPEERAEGCAEEYRQVGRAVARLVSPRLEPAEVEKARKKYRSRWNGPAPSAGER